MEQKNKQYTGSVLDPMFDEDVKIEDYVHNYDLPPYYIKYALKEDSLLPLNDPQTGFWKWEPLSDQYVYKPFFSWNVLTTFN